MQYHDARKGSGGMMRLMAVAVACVLGISVCAAAQAPAAEQPAAEGIPAWAVWPSNLPNPAPLWPNGAPGAQGTTFEDIPTLAAFIPASNPTKTAVIVAPGGGYTHLSMIKEG